MSVSRGKRRRSKQPEPATPLVQDTNSRASSSDNEVGQHKIALPSASDKPTRYVCVTGISKNCMETRGTKFHADPYKMRDWHFEPKGIVTHDADESRDWEYEENGIATYEFETIAAAQTWVQDLATMAPSSVKRTVAYVTGMKAPRTLDTSVKASTESVVISCGSQLQFTILHPFDALNNQPRFQVYVNTTERRVENVKAMAKAFAKAAKIYERICGEEGESIREEVMSDHAKEHAHVAKICRFDDSEGDI